MHPPANPGPVPDGGHRPTRSDVAHLAGVSAAVVSYVVNDGPRPVSAQTRQKVLAAISALDYHPNAAARALRMRRSGVIGLVVPDVSNTYFGTLAHEITACAADHGLAIFLGDSNQDRFREAAQVRSLIDRGVDGLIIASVDTSLPPSDSGDTPTVYLDRLPQHGQKAILVDSFGGATAAVNHLSGHGRAAIGHIAGPQGALGADERVNGWRHALQEIGALAGLQHLARAPFTRQGGLHAGIEMLTDPSRRPDALFVSSDVQALGVLHAARLLSVRVPDDLAVISFDGTEEAIYSDPPLTAIEQPVSEIAESAIRTILSGHAATTRPISPHLTIRVSCGCPG